MPISDAVKPVQKVTMSELAESYANHMGVVSWGTPGAKVGNVIEVELQLKNALQSNLEKEEILRLTTGGDATMSLAAEGAGTVLSGDGTADMIVQLSATGTFDIEVTDATSETATVITGVTQGSGQVDCGETVDLDFSAA